MEGRGADGVDKHRTVLYPRHLTQALNNEVIVTLNSLMLAAKR